MIRNDKGSLFFKIYFSPEFPQMTTVSGTYKIIPTSDYSIGSIDTGSYVFQNEVTRFMNYYKNFI